MNDESTCQNGMKWISGEGKEMSPLKFIDRYGGELDSGDVFKWGAGETYVVFAQSGAGVSAFNEQASKEERDPYFRKVNLK